MRAFREAIANQVAEAAGALAAELGLKLEVSADDLLIETPPRPELGDVSFPMFPLAKFLKMAPAVIARELSPLLLERGLRAQIAGPYINIHLDRAETISSIMRSLEEAPEGSGSYGSNQILAGKRIVIEFSSPNTNKPLHLGHLRNNALGESLARILEANGAELRRVNLINDRGVQICKSMLAYKEHGAGKTPEDLGMKPDHFVGKYYVLYNEMDKRKEPGLEQRVQEMLRRWEEGDEEVQSLWKTMKDWAMEGLMATYERSGIRFDTVYYESETYKLGREHVLAGLEKGLFYRDDEGTVWIDLDDIGLDRKVLLRQDGTSVYITQDIGTALSRHGDWPFDRMFYVVANEQDYHFKVLFHVLKKLGLEWAGNLAHLSYGMVNIPQGKMKSREGTVVDADNLLDELQSLALNEIMEKGRDSELADPGQTAEAVALAALYYYLLQVSPSKDMLFKPRESLSFSGNTGPYLQYMGARISSMLRKHGGGAGESQEIDWGQLREDIEWELAKLISRFPEAVEAAGRNYDPTRITAYLYELGKSFSRFYHEYPVLNCPQPKLRDARLGLARAVREILYKGFKLINVPFLEEM